MAATKKIRATDAQARIRLPTSFANATVIVEEISETEVRIRKVVFAEETRKPLSDRDRDRFFQILVNPATPTPALKKAIARHKARRG